MLRPALYHFHPLIFFNLPKNNHQRREHGIHFFRRQIINTDGQSIEHSIHIFLGNNLNKV